MDDGMLSQDEIDALLNVTSDEDDNADDSLDQVEEKPKSNEEAANLSNYLSSIEVDTLGEIGNITFGSSATTLSTLLSQKVDITTPKVSVIKKSGLRTAFGEGHVSVQVNYADGFSGENLFVIKTEDAAIISDIMLGGDGTSPDLDLSDIHLSAVQEAMNQMMGAAATSMSTLFDKLINISPPSIDIMGPDNTAEDKLADTYAGEEEIFVKVAFDLKVGELIDSSIMQLIPIPFANELVAQLLNGTTDDSQEEVAAAVAEVNPPIVEEAKQSPQKAINKAQTETQENQNKSPQFIGDPVDQQNASIQQATFAEFDSVELNKTEQRNLDMLLDIPLKITVELGRTKQPIKDILDLASGSIIELDKLAGEPVDVLVNDKLIAKGEVVVIDENFGVRVTDIISQSARIMKLK